MEFEPRLVVVLLRVLTEDVKTPAMEADAGDESIRSQRLLEELFLQVRPGGLEEQQTLVKFLRNLNPASTARDAIDILRRWRLAKNRVSSLAFPEVLATNRSRRSALSSKPEHGQTWWMHLWRPVPLQT